MGTDTDPVEIVRQGLAKAEADHNDYVFIDTAGRLQIDEQLMDELARIKALANPNEIMLVVWCHDRSKRRGNGWGFNDKLDVTRRSSLS